MHRIKHHLLTVSILFALYLLLSGQEGGGCTPEPQAPVGVDNFIVGPLLQTQWGQQGEYATFAPNNQRLGCWSTAIAQILYFHRLQPYGTVEYYSSKYDADDYPEYHIKENLESYPFDWELFVNNIDGSTIRESIDQVATYAYSTSIVLQKDWDTGGYMLSHSERANEVENHYDCTTKWYSSLTYLSTTKAVIIEEIDANRPLMMHLRSKNKENYHAVVVDGYQWKEEEFYVHINMGHEGAKDGWYLFDGPITSTYDDTSYRRIMTIKPD